MFKLSLLTTAAVASVSATEHLFDGPKSTFTRLIAEREKILDLNKDLIAKQENVATRHENLVSKQEKGTNNLRTLRDRGPQEGTILLQGYSGADCSGFPVVAVAWRTFTCERHVLPDGRPGSRMIQSTNMVGEDLAMVFNWYYGDKCDPLRTLASIDLADQLPPHDGNTWGDCLDGYGIALFLVEGDVNLGDNAIVETHSGGYDNCRRDNWAEGYANYEGICYCSDDDCTTTFTYEFGKCQKTGYFRKTEYSDGSCTAKANEITGNEEFERCLFNLDALVSARDENSVSLLDYRSTFCYRGRPGPVPN